MKSLAAWRIVGNKFQENDACGNWDWTRFLGIAVATNFTAQIISSFVNLLNEQKTKLITIEGQSKGLSWSNTTASELDLQCKVFKTYTVFKKDAYNNSLFKKKSISKLDLAVTLKPAPYGYGGCHIAVGLADVRECPMLMVRSEKHGMHVHTGIILHHHNHHYIIWFIPVPEIAVYGFAFHLGNTSVIYPT